MVRQTLIYLIFENMPFKMIFILNGQVMNRWASRWGFVVPHSRVAFALIYRESRSDRIRVGQSLDTCHLFFDRVHDMSTYGAGVYLNWSKVEMTLISLRKGIVLLGCSQRCSFPRTHATYKEVRSHTNFYVIVIEHLKLKS